MKDVLRKLWAAVKGDPEKMKWRKEGESIEAFHARMMRLYPLMAWKVGVDGDVFPTRDALGRDWSE